MSKNKKDDLDTETSFADMNVEGFSWYDPSKKKSTGKQKTTKQKVSRREYWRMVGGAYRALLPFILATILAALLVIGFAYLWLRH